LSVLIFLIPITLILGFIGLLSFIWCIKNNQYQDLKGDSARILFDNQNEDNAKK
jgi:cbb3-type cytochrome oxidase maturation protein